MLYHFVSVQVLIICPAKSELVYTLYEGPRNQDKEIKKIQKYSTSWQFMNKDKQ